MAPLFSVNILTENKKAYEGQIQSLVAPGELGYLGILANHAPLITTLVPGKITLKKDTGEIIFFNSGGKGFLNILKNDATLLLDSVEPATTS